MLLKQDNLGSSIQNFVFKKYSLKKITGFLRSSNKKNISFHEIRKMLDMSKRRFYPRLRIIKKYVSGKPDFNWGIKRGKFVRLE